jgi:hypothetical protein
MLSLRKRAANDYLSKHKGHFVTITKFDEYKIKGVLKEVTPDFMLLIENNYGSIWRIDPLDIKEFYGRPDRNIVATRGDN